MKKKLILAGIALFLSIQTALAFIGEEGFISELMDLMSRRVFTEYVTGIAESMRYVYYEHFTDLLLMNPDPLNPEILGIINNFIYLLGSLYVLAMIVSGIYLIFLSGSPTGRAAVKSMFPLIIAGIVLVVLSPHIINPLLYVSGLLTSTILSLWSGNPMDVLNPENVELNPVNYFISRFHSFSWSSLEASAPLLFLSLFITAGSLILIIIRYLAVTLFVVIFPLTIFLYIFLPTRGIGRSMLEQTLLWTSVQVTEAIALISIVSIISLIPVSEIRVIVMISGALMLLVVPIATVSIFRNFLP